VRDHSALGAGLEPDVHPRLLIKKGSSQAHAFCGEDADELNPAVSNPYATCVHQNTVAILETTTWPFFVHAVEQRLPGNPRRVLYVEPLATECRRRLNYRIR
jgi:hypothetical protein